MWRICVAWAPRRRMLISNDKPGNEDVGLMERIPFRILRSFESSVCERRVQLRHVSRKLSCGNFPGAGKLSDLPPGAPCGSSSAGIRRPRAAEKPKGTLDMDHDEVRQFIEAAARRPLLTHDEEHDLDMAAGHGDEEARKELMAANLRLVV